MRNSTAALFFPETMADIRHTIYELAAQARTCGEPTQGFHPEEEAHLNNLIKDLDNQITLAIDNAYNGKED